MACVRGLRQKLPGIKPPDPCAGRHARSWRLFFLVAVGGWTQVLNHLILITAGAKKAVFVTVVSLGVLALAVDPTTFAAAVVTVITALAGATVLIINAMATAKKEILDHTASLSAKADQIKNSVDGTASTAAAKIAALQGELTQLREMMAEKKETAALLAQGAVTATAAEAAREQTKLISEALHAKLPEDAK
jgi:hypothetical protein